MVPSAYFNTYVPINKQEQMQESSWEGPCVNLMTDKKGIQKDCYNVPNLPKALITIPFDEKKCS